MFDRLHERGIPVETHHVAQLDQEQQYRGSILEACHHWVRNELDQRSQLYQTEQPLNRAREYGDKKQYAQSEHQVHAVANRVRVHQLVEEDSEKERGRNAWCVHIGGLVALRYASEAHYE